MRALLASLALGAVLALAGAATACELDGVVGAHRYVAFQPVAVTNTSVSPPSTPARPSRERASRRNGNDGNWQQQRTRGRRSDDGQGYSSYYNVSSDTSTGGGTPGDANWLHEGPHH